MWIIQQMNYEVAMVPSDHLRISNLYLMHALQQHNETHCMTINAICAQYFYLNADTGAHMWGMYLCLGNGIWQEILFSNWQKAHKLC